MKFAYADPPYYGCAAKLYPEHPESWVYDTLDGWADLIARIVEYDGWALSTHTPGLRSIIPLCPEDCRVAAWVKPFASFKKGVNPAYAWEPVIFKSARGAAERVLPVKGGGMTSTRDFIACPITLKRGLVGAKPEDVCRWIFDLMGAQPGDEFSDLFPGTGAVGRAWERFTAGVGAQALMEIL